VSGPNILIAGGGSGGHISPGIALSEAFQRRFANATCTFACSNRPIDAAMLQHVGAAARPLPACPPSKTPGGLIRFLHRFRQSDRSVRAMLRSDRTDLVVLLGGFVAAPVARAACRRGVPTVLVNLDRVPGRANRWMRPRVSRVLSAVTTTIPFADTVTGMPVRSAATPPGDRRHCRRLCGIPESSRVLLVTGASQGAGSVNRLLPTIAGDDSGLLADWHVLHLTGRGNREAVEADWARTDHTAVTIDEFTHEMGPLWGAADLVISRAGACSVAEIELAGVPAIYLPYPHHRDEHQRHNAAPAVEAGAARIVPDVGDRTSRSMSFRSIAGDLLADPGALRVMQAAAAARRPTNAADAIAEAAAALLDRKVARQAPQEAAAQRLTDKNARP